MLLAAPFPIPWQVLIRLGRRGCGGTILDSETILTAAHCTNSLYNNNPNYYVKAGITEKNAKDIGPGQIALIKSYTVHPNWNQSKLVQIMFSFKI